MVDNRIDWSAWDSTNAPSTPSKTPGVIDWSTAAKEMPSNPSVAGRSDKVAPPPNDTGHIDWAGAAAPRIPNTEPKMEVKTPKGLYFWNTTVGDLPAVTEAPELTFGLQTGSAYEAKRAPSQLEQWLHMGKDTNPILRYPTHVVGGGLDVALAVPQLGIQTAEQMKPAIAPGEVEKYGKVAGDVGSALSDLWNEVHTKGVSAIPGAYGKYVQNIRDNLPKDIAETGLGHNQKVISDTATGVAISIPTSILSDFRHPDVFLNNPAQAAADMAILRASVKGVKSIGKGAVEAVKKAPTLDIEKAPTDTPFTHYSSQGNLSIIDPEFAGRGQQGSEWKVKANYPKEYQPVTYMYDPKAQVESRFVGNTKYQVTDSGNILTGKDPAFSTILEKANKKSTNSSGFLDSDLRDQTFYKLAKEEGYDTVALGEGRGAVALTPRPVRPAFDITPQGLKGNYTIVTAQNPGSPLMAKIPNGVDANAYLIKELTDKGYRPIPAKGMFGGQTEDSFIVPDLSEIDAHRLMLKYGQQAVVTQSGLLTRDGLVTPMKDFTLQGKPFDDNFTVVNMGGKPLFFQMGFDEASPKMMAGLLTEDGKTRVAPIPMGKPVATQMPKPLAAELMPQVEAAFNDNVGKGMDAANKAVTDVLKDKFPGLADAPESTKGKPGYAEGWDEHVKNINTVLSTAQQMGTEGEKLRTMAYQTIMGRMQRMANDFGYKVNEENAAKSYINRMIPNFGKSIEANIQNMGDFVGQVKRTAQAMVDPASLSDNARLAADSLKGELAESARRYEILKNVTEAGEKVIDKMSDAEKLKTAYLFETGKSLGNADLDAEIRKPLRDASADRIARLH